MPAVISEALVPVILVLPPAPSASVKQALPSGMPGQAGSMASSNCADEPGRTRSSRAAAASVLPTRCGGKVAAA